MAVLSVPNNEDAVDKIDGSQCFELLQDAIARLKRNIEREEVSEVWVTKSQGKDNCVSDHDLLFENTTTLQRLKEARSFLDLLSESLDVELSAFEAKTATGFLINGIMKLPNEVLELIFADVCDDAGHYGPEELSQVCQRFRSIVFRIAKLWTSVNSNMTKHTLKRHFSLSRDLPLSVSLLPMCGCSSRALSMLPDGTESTWASFLKLTTRHAHRWGSLSIDTGDQEENMATFLDYPGRTVKSLESLTVVYPVYDEEGDFHAHLHSDKWKFPHITSLRTKFNIPLPNCFKSLTACTLGSPHPGSDLCIFGIAEFLRSTPALERLSITDLGDPALSGVIHPIEKHLRARLPKLRFFSIWNTNPGGPERSVSTEMVCIMDAIAMPNVEEIYMSINYGDNEDFADLLKEVTTRYKFDSLKCITYSCYGDSDDHSLVICIPRIMDNFPKLESLSLHTPYHYFCVCSITLVRPQQLRSLRMQRDHESAFNQLKQAVASIKRAKGSVAKFEVVDDVSEGNGLC